jgi:hypothetical protein
MNNDELNTLRVEAAEHLRKAKLIMLQILADDKQAVTNDNVRIFNVISNALSQLSKPIENPLLDYNGNDRFTDI